MGLPLSIMSRRKLLLDSVKGSAAAYSLRKLSKSATSAIKVRRSVDNAEQIIGFSGKDLDTASLLSFVGGENLLLQSEALSTTWVPTKLTTTINGTDFLGNVSTNLLASATESIARYNIQTITKATSTAITYTLSCYAKAGTYGYIKLRVDGGSSSNGCYATFNLSNGNVENSGQAGTWTYLSSACELSGDSYYRCRITFTTSTEATFRVFLGIANTNDMAIGTSVATINDVLLKVSGLQLNTGSTATAYTETTTAIAGAGYVTTWYDQSGTSNATQSTSVRQPIIVNAGAIYTLNSAVSIYFNTGTCLSHKLTTDTSMFSINAVGKKTTSSTAAYIYNMINVIGFGTISDNLASFYGNGATWANTSANSPTTSNLNNSCIFSSIKSGIINQPYANGTAKNARNEANATVENGDGFIGDNVNVNVNYKGLVPELMIYNRTLSDSERQKIEKSQSKYYGITLE